MQQSLKLKIKVEDEERLSEVYVSIASIVTGLEVHGQVEIVKSVGLPLLDHLKKVLLRKAHRDVFDHYCRQILNPIQNRMKINRIVGELCDLVHW